MGVSELEGSVTLDFLFRLYWLDERLSIPSLWNALSKTTAIDLLADGADISGLIRDCSNQLNVWLPDIHFVDAREVNYLAETIKIRPNGVMYWSRHTVLTVQQPAFRK